MKWTSEAEVAVKKVPFFIRKKVHLVLKMMRQRLVKKKYHLLMLRQPGLVKHGERFAEIFQGANFKINIHALHHNKI